MKMLPPTHMASKGRRTRLGMGPKIIPALVLHQTNTRNVKSDLIDHRIVAANAHASFKSHRAIHGAGSEIVDELVLHHINCRILGQSHRTKFEDVCDLLNNTLNNIVFTKIHC